MTPIISRTTSGKKGGVKIACIYWSTQWAVWAVMPRAGTTHQRFQRRTSRTMEDDKPQHDVSHLSELALWNKSPSLKQRWAYRVAALGSQWKGPYQQPESRGWGMPYACSALQQLLTAPTQGSARPASTEYFFPRITEPIRLEKASKIIESKLWPNTTLPTEPWHSHVHSNV